MRIALLALALLPAASAQAGWRLVDQVCNPGCQYIDVPTGDCRGGAEMARVYTCEPDSSAQEVSGSGVK